MGLMVSEKFFLSFTHFKSIEAYDSMASINTRSIDGKIYVGDHKVRKMAKIRNRYNQAPHLTKNTNGKVTTSQLDITNESQEVSPFPAGDHKASINIRARKHNKNKQINPRHKSISRGSRRFREEDFLKFFPLYVYICQRSNPIRKKTNKHMHPCHFHT